MINVESRFLVFTYQCEDCATSAVARRCPRCGTLKDVIPSVDDPALVDVQVLWSTVQRRWNGTLEACEWYMHGPDRELLMIVEAEGLIPRMVRVIDRFGEVQWVESDGTWIKVE